MALNRAELCVLPRREYRKHLSTMQALNYYRLFAMCPLSALISTPFGTKLFYIARSILGDFKMYATYRAFLYVFYLDMSLAYPRFIYQLE
jgi:hypothetical protein